MVAAATELPTNPDAVPKTGSLIPWPQPRLLDGPEQIGLFLVDEAGRIKRASSSLSEGTLHIAAPAGTPVWASAEGEVLYSGHQDGYGRIVIIQHEGQRVTIYAHNRENCVADGDRVGRGDPVALVGRSGGATSPYVHFEVREGAKTVNPRRFLP